VRTLLVALVSIFVAMGSAGADESLPNPPGAAAKKPRVTIAGDRLQLGEPIYFDAGKATIKPISSSLLDEVVAVLSRNAQLELVEVQVHTDARGAAEFNLRLSGERAAAVKAYLIEHGIAAGRLQSRGYGETQPLCTDPDERCRSRNRRTELVIVRAR
jgi:outer membrane protein OmpA-like peptidoglycan-associated protein